MISQDYLNNKKDSASDCNREKQCEEENKNILNEDCKDELKSINCKILKFDEPMSKHTSFKIGGEADAFISIENIEDLKKVINVAKKYNLPITIVGNGTNLLVKDNGIRGIVINFADSSFKILDNTGKEENAFNSKSSIDEENENNTINKEIETEINEKSNTNIEVKVEVSAGMKNGVLAQELLKKELSGFEFASGIPGTIGGAIYMNAGAFGSEMSNIVESLTYIDLKDLTVHSIENKDCKFAYRTSIFEEEESKNETANKKIAENKINIENTQNESLKKFDEIESKKYEKKLILNAVLKLSKGCREEIYKKMEEYKAKRLATQPLDKPSAGSTFKRGNNFITAKLIDECNLKGYKIGGAEVSTKHAGFIVNSGNATADDVIKLMKYVEEKVYQKFGVRIEKELRIIGQ